MADRSQLELCEGTVRVILVSSTGQRSLITPLFNGSISLNHIFFYFLLDPTEQLSLSDSNRDSNEILLDDDEGLSVQKFTSKQEIFLTISSIQGTIHSWIGKKIKVWYEHEQMYEIATIFSRLKNDSFKINWEKGGTEIMDLKVADMTEDPTNDERWSFVDGNEMVLDVPSIPFFSKKEPPKKIRKCGICGLVIDKTETYYASDSNPVLCESCVKNGEREVSVVIGNSWILSDAFVPNSVVSTLLNCFDLYKFLPCVGVKEKDTKSFSIDWKSYEELQRDFISIGSGLRCLGLNPGDIVGIAAKNCYQFTVTILACLYQGLIYAPFHATFNETQIKALISTMNIKCVVCDASESLKTWNATDAVQHDFYIVEIDEKEFSQHEKDSVHRRVLGFGLVQSMGQQKLLGPSPHSQEIDCVSLVFTSGSTGTPKGAVETKSKVLETLQNGLLGSDPGYTVHFEYMPMTHGVARDNFIQAILCGGKTFLFSGDSRKEQKEGKEKESK